MKRGVEKVLLVGTIALVLGGCATSKTAPPFSPEEVLISKECSTAAEVYTNLNANSEERIYTLSDGRVCP